MLARKRATVASQNTRVEEQTHQYTGVIPIETFPKELQVLIKNFNKGSSIKDLRSVIQKLCTCQPLTAQQLAEILKRKDKKKQPSTLPPPKWRWAW
mgnify:CR=1 FL=1